MINRKIIIRLFWLICCLSWMPTVQAQNGIYFTLAGGLAKQSGLPSPYRAEAQSKSTKLPSAVRVSVGYNHDLSAYLGVGLDIGLGQYGADTYSYPTHHVRMWSQTLEFLAFAQLHYHQWDVSPRMGGIRQTFKITGYPLQANETQIRPAIGFGAAYNITSQFAFILDYIHVFGDQIRYLEKEKNKTPSLNAGLVGIRLTF